MSFFKNSLAVLTRPRKAFSMIGDLPASDMAKSAAIVVLLFAVISQLIFQSAIFFGVWDFKKFETSLTATDVLYQSIFRGVSILIYVFFAAAISHLFIFLANRKRTLVRTVKAWFYGSTPLFLIMPFPDNPVALMANEHLGRIIILIQLFLLAVSIVWALTLQVYGLNQLHKLSPVGTLLIGVFVALSMLWLLLLSLLLLFLGYLGAGWSSM